MRKQGLVHSSKDRQGRGLQWPAKEWNSINRVQQPKRLSPLLPSTETWLFHLQIYLPNGIILVPYHVFSL